MFYTNCDMTDGNVFFVLQQLATELQSTPPPKRLFNKYQLIVCNRSYSSTLSSQLEEESNDIQDRYIQQRCEAIPGLGVCLECSE